jgi:hypothetical protein
MDGGDEMNENFILDSMDFASNGFVNVYRETGVTLPIYGSIHYDRENAMRFSDTRAVYRIHVKIKETGE